MNAGPRLACIFLSAKLPGNFSGFPFQLLQEQLNTLPA